MRDAAVRRDVRSTLEVIRGMFESARLRTPTRIAEGRTCASPIKEAEA